MAQSNEKVDFSGLFKLDVLIHADIVSYSFYEVGLKKFFAFSSDKELFFIYIDPLSKRFERNYDWDFVDNPVYCMCFEPSGTWAIILSEQKVLLVPFLPQFIPQNDFDHKWSLSSVTVLPLGNIPKPTSVVFWLTKESENILIIASKVLYKFVFLIFVSAIHFYNTKLDNEILIPILFHNTIRSL